MKFSISTLLLTIALVAVSIGWWSERRYYWKYTGRFVDYVASVSAASHENSIYHQVDNYTPENFKTAREEQLLRSFLRLHQVEPWGNANDIPSPRLDDSALHSAGLMVVARGNLQLLQIHDLEGLRDKIREYEEDVSPYFHLIDRHGNLTPSISDFTMRALKH